ncbi:MAG: molybdenum cofactor guanylyltransferase MobA [Alistipes senegalensis]|nr:molybdenum cofactor guanylyltransferase MobA [Oxalobacter formigenes]MCM1281023.1 molybdenum cofactor guanylyltransferase MobA [Alistipes senegalensis]
MIISRTDITGLVLAGGKGTRMGSIDKGLQLFFGKPLFLHAIDRLKPQVASVFVNANRNEKQYAQAGFTVLPDMQPDFAGPLAGFAAGLARCQTPYLLVVPCDSPFFPDNLASKLGAALQDEKTEAAIAVTGHAPSFSLQPVFCLMKREILPNLQAFLATGQRKIASWYATLSVSKVYFPDESAFDNINTLQELKRQENKHRNNIKYKT